MFSNAHPFREGTLRNSPRIPNRAPPHDLPLIIPQQHQRTRLLWRIRRQDTPEFGAVPVDDEVFQGDVGAAPAVSSAVARV
jgi:hypothetical protein